MRFSISINPVLWQRIIAIARRIAALQCRHLASTNCGASTKVRDNRVFCQLLFLGSTKRWLG
jgi:hypothetical protein